MTDVEKYGAFALVFVVGILGLILLYGAGDDDPDGASGRGQPIVIRTADQIPPGSMPAAPSSRRRPVDAPQGAGRDGKRQPAVYRVRSPVDGAGTFDFREAPIEYPGERSSRGGRRDGTEVHVVRQGETLSDISKTYYGTTTRWRDLLVFNPGLEPRKMRPGDEIVVAGPSPAIKRSMLTADASQAVPRVESAPVVARPVATEPAPKQATYVVQKGDTLGEIAQAMLGSATRVDELFKANTGVLASPHELKVGMELRIP